SGSIGGMGTNSRDRRRQKKRREVAADRARLRRRTEAAAMPGPRGIDAGDVERMLARAVCAQRDRDEALVEELSEIIAEGPTRLGHRARDRSAGPTLLVASAARAAFRGTLFTSRPGEYPHPRTGAGAAGEGGVDDVSRGSGSPLGESAGAHGPPCDRPRPAR